MSTIKTQVMGAVMVVRAVRMAVGPTALKLYAFALSVWGIGRLVWVSKVFENLHTVEKSGVSAVGNFMLAAVSHTHAAVQLMLLVAIVAAFLLAVDFIRAAAPASRRLAA